MDKITTLGIDLAKRVRCCAWFDGFLERALPEKIAIVDDEQVRPVPGHSDELGGSITMPTNVWEPGARLSSGPER